MTSYKDVVSAFESIIKCKYVIDESLVYQWFLNALGEFELNIDTLGFDRNKLKFNPADASSKDFDKNGFLSQHVIMTLAEVMKSYYMQQEVRRVNQLNNIIGKDLSLNGTGDTKKYTKAEADTIDYKIADLYTKQKVAAYI